MFKLRRKKKNVSVTVRAEELQPGDRLLLDATIVEVLEILRGPEVVNVRLLTAQPGASPSTARMPLYPEMLITVIR